MHTRIPHMHTRIPHMHTTHVHMHTTHACTHTTHAHTHTTHAHTHIHTYKAKQKQTCSCRLYGHAYPAKLGCLCTKQALRVSASWGWD